MEKPKTPLMKCGHAANAINLSDGGKPICAICYLIVDGADEVDEKPPTLEGRMARCVYSRGRDGSPCGRLKPSSADLPFFESKPDQDQDRFYCGCWGWD